MLICYSGREKRAGIRGEIEWKINKNCFTMLVVMHIYVGKVNRYPNSIDLENIF